MKYHGSGSIDSSQQGQSLKQILYAIAVFSTLIVTFSPGSASAQATSTPVPAVLLTPTPEGRNVVLPTNTLAPTSTPLPAIRLQALASAGNVNVRALPSLEAEILGTIAQGVEYQVLRSFYRWYEFRTDISPNGRAWVFGDLVELTGDRSQIEIIEDPSDISTPLEIEASSGDSAQVERDIAISTIQAGSAQSVELVEITALPTFTSPAPTPASISAQLEFEAAERPPWANIPPIAPIALLGGLGLLGLLISAIRR